MNKNKTQNLEISLTNKILLAIAENSIYLNYPKSIKQQSGWDLKKYYHLKEIEKMENKIEKRRIQKTITRLVKNGVLNKKDNITLTPKGWLKFISWYSTLYQKNPNKKQNKNEIYLIIFDIPEKYRKVRDLLRRALYHWGFDMIQKSVFLTYDKKAFKFMQQLVAHADVKQFVKFISGNYIK